MADSTREKVLKALVKVDRDSVFSNIAMKEMLAECHEAQDRRFAAGLYLGVLQNRLRLDQILQQFSKVKLKKMTVWIRNILRMGLYQILDMHVPSHAACGESVKLARRYGHPASAGLVNGILRAVDRNPEQVQIPPKEDTCAYLAFFYSCPMWMVRKFLHTYGKKETEQILAAYHTAHAPTVRTNTLKIAPQDLIVMLKNEGRHTKADIALPYALHLEGELGLAESTAYQQGFYTLQNINSMWAAEALDPQAGETVMDLCAAPGGKTTHIAEKMKDRGEVLAFDVYPHKIRLIQTAAKRLGLTCIKAEEGDASQYNPQFFEKADRVLLDAPCSGLGVLHKKPDICWRRKEEDIPPLVEMQKKMLANAARYVKKGGILVYSTCTLLREENEGQIEEFLNVHPEFVKCEEQVLHTYQNGGNGFYICKMQKTNR